MDYSVALMLRSEHESKRLGLWECVVVLVEASSDAEARSKAERLAERYEAKFETADGDRVRWRFEAIQRIEPIEYGEGRTGTELYSIHLTEAEARSILNPIDDDA
jgi:hypothetical protein